MTQMIMVGVTLFDADAPSLAGHISLTEDKLALLPKHVRKTKTVDDEF